MKWRRRLGSGSRQSISWQRITSAKDSARIGHGVESFVGALELLYRSRGWIMRATLDPRTRAVTSREQLLSDHF